MHICYFTPIRPMDEELLNLEFHVSKLFKILTTVFSQVSCIRTLKLSPCNIIGITHPKFFFTLFKVAFHPKYNVQAILLLGVWI